MNFNSSLKTTAWFPAEVTPVRVGVYQIEPWPKDLQFSYWDGHRWGWRMLTAADANHYRSNRALGSVGRWRGLAKKRRG